MEKSKINIPDPNQEIWDNLELIKQEPKRIEKFVTNIKQLTNENLLHLKEQYENVLFSIEKIDKIEQYQSANELAIIHKEIELRKL